MLQCIFLVAGDFSFALQKAGQRFAEGRGWTYATSGLGRPAWKRICCSPECSSGNYPLG